MNQTMSHGRGSRKPVHTPKVYPFASPAGRRYWLAVELRYYVRRAFSAALALLGGAR